MKANRVCALLVALFVCAFVGPAAAQVRFETGSTDSVRRMAQQQNKLVFIDLYANWCPPCRAMERQVFSQQEVGDFMAKHFIAAKYNVDETTGRELMSEYGRGSIPLYLVFDTGGNLWVNSWTTCARSSPATKKRGRSSWQRAKEIRSPFQGGDLGVVGSANTAERRKHDRQKQESETVVRIRV